MSEPQITEEQKQVALRFMNEGAKIERERILEAITSNGSKTISVKKLLKMITGE